MKNYRIKEELITHQDGSKKTIYKFQKKDSLNNWEDLPFCRKMITDNCYCVLRAGEYQLDDKEKADFLLTKILKADKKIYGTEIIPLIMIYSNNWNSWGGLGKHSIDIVYTCRELLDEKNNRIKILKKNLDELKDYLYKKHFGSIITKSEGSRHKKQRKSVLKDVLNKNRK